MKFSRNFEVLDQALLGYVYTRENFSRFKNVSEFMITFRNLRIRNPLHTLFYLRKFFRISH